MAEEKSAWSAPPIGTPCWVEIPASNVTTCKKFYSTLFPLWDFKPSTEQYPENKIAMFAYGGKMGLHGGIVHVESSTRSEPQPDGVGTTIYHFVDSIDETQKLIQELGGKKLSEKTPEGENGCYMYFADVEGNRFGIYELMKKEGQGV